MTENNWNDLDQPNWAYAYNPLYINAAVGAPDPPNALQFKYPKGLVAGTAPSVASYNFPSSSYTEVLWWQYWFKYDPEWTWQTITNKQVYFNLEPDAPNTSNSFVAVGMHGNQKLVFVNQITWGKGTKNYYPNTSYDPDIQAGRWYKLTGHMVLNTPGMEDGIIRVWLDDQLVIDYKTIPYRSADENGKKWGRFRYVPVYGGGDTGQGLPGDGPKPKDEYFWVDQTIISTEPISNYPGIVGTKAPKPPFNLTIE